MEKKLEHESILFETPFYNDIINHSNLKRNNFPAYKIRLFILFIYHY